MSNLFNGQAVKVAVRHNQFRVSKNTIYHVGSINKVMGEYSVQLLKAGRCVGAIPERNLEVR